MNRVAAVWRRIPAWLTDLLAVAVAAIDAFLYNGEPDAATVVTCVVASAAMLIRRRWPLVAFLLTLPAALVANILAAPVIALFALSVRTRNRWLLVVCGGLFAAAEAIGWPITDQLVANQNWTFVTFVYQLATAAAPILLGQLVQIAADLRARIDEIEATKRHERELYAQSLLARERNQLAREMHDVVSHQVSLIAVQAGALQVTAPDEETRGAAASIRALSSTTLDELRSMVTLLRAAGTESPGLAPQPTVADLPGLIAASGLPVTFSGELPDDLGSSSQRAIYRTVQEALTNARKHAPGAPVSVHLWSNETSYGVTVVNGRATEPPLLLPSSRLGLIGLRERAELLGGSLSSGATEGGFHIHLVLPRTPA
ncbi:histidine kinase [Leifsonia soli]|uniref:histidine kinase n=1 Tax=Leifsonia soli TaxID=582665 RepID=A0A852T2I2_9MICO|nr:signal transduction histidine kinase [Leifsonia soli]